MQSGYDNSRGIENLPRHLAVLAQSHSLVQCGKELESKKWLDLVRRPLLAPVNGSVLSSRGTKIEANSTTRASTPLLRQICIKPASIDGPAMSPTSRIRRTTARNFPGNIGGINKGTLVLPR
jgi:hypothetical protein